MNRGNNEGGNNDNLPSIRLKYKGAHGKKSKINYETVKETKTREISSGSGVRATTEEKVVSQKESTITRGTRGAPMETSSKTTTKTVIQEGNGGKSRQQITITKTETNEKSQNSRAVSGQNGNATVISKTTEIQTTNNDNINRNRGRKVKEETTTKTMTTTTTNKIAIGGTKTETNTTENSSTQRRGRSVKEEITKTTTNNTTQRQNSRGQNQEQKSQVVKEVTTSTSMNRRNEPNKKQVTTTQKITTANVNQGRAKEITDSTTTNTRSNQRSLIAQKSTPTLRTNKEESTTKIHKKESEKRPLSSKSEMSRDNIIRITINDTGKIPKKTYVLNVRKLDRIQQDRRQRLIYSSNLEEKEPISTNFNHNIIVIKNVTKENYSSKTNIPNTKQIVINESGKIPKKTVTVSPRKNEIIKTIKKPYKLTYENYVETNTTTTLKSGVKKIPLPTTSKKFEISKTEKFNVDDKKGGKTTETKSSRIKAEGGKTTTTTTTTTTETKTRIGRNKSEANLNKGDMGSKVTITKTEMTTESKGGKGGRLQASKSGRNISENSSTTTEKKTTRIRDNAKGETTTTTKEVITQRSGSKNRLGGEGSGSKVTTIKKTEITTGSSGDNNSGRSRSRAKQETSSTTTTTTTKTVTKTSSKVEPVEGGGVVKKFRSMRKMQK
jgi:epidermal growth factor receptor substrate 15